MIFNIKKYKSITNSMRHVCIINKTILRKENRIIKRMNSKPLKNNAGRNNSGTVTVFTKGTRHKQKYNIVDFKRSIYNIPGIVCSYKYDSKRSSFIALILFSNNICCYILGVHKLYIGNKIFSYNHGNLYSTIYNKGDSNKLLYFNTGSIIHNLEFLPTKGGIYIKSAGTYGKLIKKYIHTNRAVVLLPSKVILLTSLYCTATLGIVCNIYHNQTNLGKAGRNRWLGNKPSVRGVAMNPVDHPHGGGEGKKSNPSFKRTPWGKIDNWYKYNKRNFLQK